MSKHMVGDATRRGQLDNRALPVEDDRLIGGLWEESSGGRCRFVMVKDKNWLVIDGRL